MRGVLQGIGGLPITDAGLPKEKTSFNRDLFFFFFIMIQPIIRTKKRKSKKRDILTDSGKKQASEK